MLFLKYEGGNFWFYEQNWLIFDLVVNISLKIPQLFLEVRASHGLMVYLLCNVYCVLFTVYYVLCAMYYVLCTVFFVLYTVYCVL